MVVLVGLYFHCVSSKKDVLFLGNLIFFGGIYYGNGTKRSKVSKRNHRR